MASWVGGVEGKGEGEEEEKKYKTKASPSISPFPLTLPLHVILDMQAFICNICFFIVTHRSNSSFLAKVGVPINS